MHRKTTTVRKTVAHRGTTTRKPAVARRVIEDKKMSQLLDLLVHELQDLFHAETQVLENLPNIIKNASNDKLKQVLRDHIKETRQQVDRINKIFRIWGIPLKHQYCAGMSGLWDEGTELLSNCLNHAIKDATIIAIIQKIKHYEIASYGTARAFANLLDLKDVAAFLKESEEEEVALDKLLTKVAEGSFFTTGVNKLAIEDSFALASNGRRR